MSYIALANITLSTTDNEIVFSNIPTSVNGTTIRDLVLIFDGATSAAGVALRLRPNSATTNFSEVFMYGTGSSPLSNTGSTLDVFYTDTTSQQHAIVQIMDFAQTDKHKTILTRHGSGASGTNYVFAKAGRWASTTAISSLQLITSSSTLAAGSTLALYGIAG